MLIGRSVRRSVTISTFSGAECHAGAALGRVDEGESLGGSGASEFDHTHCGLAGFLAAGCYRLEYHFGLGVACQEDDLEVILPGPVRPTPLKVSPLRCALVEWG
jgi:hypothetical protein